MIERLWKKSRTWPTLQMQTDKGSLFLEGYYVGYVIISLQKKSLNIAPGPFPQYIMFPFWKIFWTPPPSTPKLQSERYRFSISLLIPLYTRTRFSFKINQETCKNIAQSSWRNLKFYGGGVKFLMKKAVFNVMNIYPHKPLKRLNRKPCPD